MLRLDNVTYRIAGRPIFEAASVHVPVGHKVGIVGRNGSGKTTLIRLIADEIQADDGAISRRRDARLGMLAQEAPDGPSSLLDAVLGADQERVQLLSEAETATAPDRIAEIHQRLADIQAHTAPARAARILAGLGFDEAAQARPLNDFSGGWRMRVALAAILFVEPDLLLLDEPTNYLDLEGAIWLENFLGNYPKTLLIVSHDRDFLNRVVGSILHVRERTLKLYRGNYDQFEQTWREQLVLQSKMRASQEAQRQRMQAFVDRFRYKASKARQAQSRLKAMERMAPIAAVMEARAPMLGFPTPVALPPPVIAMENVAVGYASGAPVLSGLDLRIDMDDRIALLGPNGNGKSTFAKLLADELAPMAGRMTKARKLKVGYFAQHQIDALTPEWTAYQHLAAVLPGKGNAEIRARIGRFGFAQDQANVVAGNLSGGEKARLVLALISVESPGLLVLDEPTNHLDVDTREALVQALNDYEGGVLLISHDRHLIELVADHLWLVADGTVRPFDDDLDGYRRLVLSQNGVRRTADRKGAKRSRAARRADRQAGAGDRERLAPLRARARQAEALIERLSQERDVLDAELARPDRHDSSAVKVTELNKQRAELVRQIARAEETWLDAMNALEAVNLN